MVSLSYRAVVFLFALLGCIVASLASPIPLDTETLSDVQSDVADLEKRVTHVGRGTWFHVGLGNCGKWNKDSDPIIAIAKSRYNANGGANCGQWVEIVNTRNGKKAYGLTRDSCESCGSEDIDMSPSLFQKLDSLSTGQIKVSWHFMNKAWKP